MTSYSLRYACIISMKRREKFHILLDEVHHHWKMLSVHVEDVDDVFFVMEEWNDIQERLKKAPYEMKLHIKEAMRQLTFPKDTMVSPPPRNVVTKG